MKTKFIMLERVLKTQRIDFFGAEVNLKTLLHCLLTAFARVESGLFIYFGQVIKIFSEQATKILFDAVEFEATFLELCQNSLIFSSILLHFNFYCCVSVHSSESMVWKTVASEFLIVLNVSVPLFKWFQRMNVTNLIARIPCRSAYIIKMDVYLENVFER